MAKRIIKNGKENFIDTLKGKKVLFLENDNGLHNGLDTLEEVLKENDIKYTCLFEVSELPFEETIKQIQAHDAIIFQTQWVYDISKAIKQYMIGSKEKKTVIECYLYEPTWYYKPDVVHDVFICNAPIRYWEDDVLDDDDWKFYMLSNKPYWDYKNNFNK